MEVNPQLGLCDVTLPSMSDLNYMPRHIVERILQKESVFITGGAGVGKTFLIKKKLLRIFNPQSKCVAVTASTALAACQISSSATTIYKFAGIRDPTASLESTLAAVRKSKTTMERWRRTTILFIDEISMIDSQTFTKLDAIGRYVRENEEAFGGIQLIVSGDFLQLPPVGRRHINTHTHTHTERPRDMDVSFAFNSPAWTNCRLKAYELTEVVRQSDTQFAGALNAIRMGVCDDTCVDILMRRVCVKIQKNPSGVIPCRLMPTRSGVEAFNESQLAGIKETQHIFTANDWAEEEWKNVNLDTSLSAPRELKLKIGAQIILIKTTEMHRSLVNGVRGVVRGIDPVYQKVTVVWNHGETSQVSHQPFPLVVGGKTVAIRRQLPLQLAWAFTIHKCQGMSLDEAVVRLGDIFEDAQAYVALSRVRRLSGLYIEGVASPDNLKEIIHANYAATQFYKKNIKKCKSIHQEYTKVSRNKSERRKRKFHESEGTGEDLPSVALLNAHLTGA